MDSEIPTPVGSSTEPKLWKTLPIETKVNAQYSDLALADANLSRKGRNSSPIADLPEGVAEVLGSIPTIESNRPRAFPALSRSVPRSEDRTSEEVSPAELPGDTTLSVVPSTEIPSTVQLVGELPTHSEPDGGGMKTPKTLQAQNLLERPPAVSSEELGHRMPTQPPQNTTEAATEPAYIAPRDISPTTNRQQEGRPRIPVVPTPAAASVPSTNLEGSNSSQGVQHSIVYTTSTVVAGSPLPRRPVPAQVHSSSEPRDHLYRDAQLGTDRVTQLYRAPIPHPPAPMDTPRTTTHSSGQHQGLEERQESMPWPPILRQVDPRASTSVPVQASRAVSPVARPENKPSWKSRITSSSRKLTRSHYGQINEFLHRHRFVRTEDDDPLDTLLNAAETSLIELSHSAKFNDTLRGNLRDAERNYDHYKTQFRITSREADRLKEALRERSSQLTQANATIDRLSEQGARLETDLRSSRGRVVQTEGELKTAKEAIMAWESVWAEQQSYYDDAIAKLNQALSEQKAKTAEQEAKTADLHNYLAGQTKEPATYEATSDKVFKTALQNLSQNISNLAISVNRNRHVIPADRSVTMSLDRTCYLRRSANQTVDGGEEEWRSFIRSICLETVFEGFFHWPLGLGVFGKEGEKRDSQSMELSLPREGRARADFFGLMLRVLENPVQSHSETLLRSINTFKANSDRVETNLVQKMQSCMGQALGGGSRALVSSIVRDSGRLALRMGAQRASVLLQKPSHRDLAILGEYFTHDAGTLADGTSVQVDLVLEPCMVRIGDGRDDLTSIKVISKGSITVFT